MIKELLAGAALVATLGAAETPGAGDIPDTQAFVTYAGPGYSVLVPEGWARTQRGSIVTFTSSNNGEAIDAAPLADVIAELRTRFGATGPVTLHRTTIGGAPVTVATFTSNSAPNPVTGKRVKLEDAAYVYQRGAKRAVLVLWAPVGADNADQWKKISGSFRWR
ncbi:MAG: PsbP [Candidatus Eremiobacteraeota bacterium]|nr:PsbP [Candidatus Eremiobacteraeota bacterium]